ncbi:MAG: DUF1573 domain-containing protein [Bacteroides sp.]|nr:DUF1573 domain-containing protein [Bacteroides sp.]
MKYFSILLFIISILVSCKNNNQQQSTSKSPVYNATIVFKDSIHDFGILKNDSIIQQYEFIFKNTSNVPAVVLNVTPSCKCTSAEYSKEPIMPGKNGKITVIYDGNKDNPGFFNKSVKVRFNSLRTYNLRIQGSFTK